MDVTSKEDTLKRLVWLFGALFLIPLTGCGKYSEAEVQQTIEAVQQAAAPTAEPTAEVHFAGFSCLILA